MGKHAFPSLRSLGSWLTNLEQRLAQLEEWTQNPMDIPKVTWISGLINPQSFLTAIMQVTAQKNQWELDKLVIQTEVTKKKAKDIDSHSRDGAYIHGPSLMGARWDDQNATVDASLPKEMHCMMPVMICKAVAADKLDRKCLLLSMLQDRVQRSNLRFLRPTQDEVPSCSMGSSRCCLNYGYFLDPGYYSAPDIYILIMTIAFEYGNDLNSTVYTIHVCNYKF